jgi:8-oxo-dGTP pyrophosphatase MutT (NUDIX family)
MIRNVTCSNCNQLGHVYSNCIYPITSFGIILLHYDIEKQENQYLMIRRKNSFGFIDFVKGKYSLTNVLHIQNSIDQMADFEKKCILKNINNFENIWMELYTKTTNFKMSREYLNASRKFENLKQGISLDNKGNKMSLMTFFKNSKSSFNETEWEFPKGRKLNNESDVDCAKREFEEETGYPLFQIDIVENILPLNEIFMGSNYRHYKHTYFLAVMTNKLSYKNFQISEVSNIEWKNLDNCISSIREYHFEKIRLIKKVDQIFKSLHFPFLEQTFQKTDSVLLV